MAHLTNKIKFLNKQTNLAPLLPIIPILFFCGIEKMYIYFHKKPISYADDWWRSIYSTTRATVFSAE